MSRLIPVKKGEVLVLRTCNEDMTSLYDCVFKWRKRGWVEAPDWNPEKVCGGGLHGALWGEGKGNLLEWSTSAKWLVVAVPEETIIDLDGKVKFPRGRVVHTGDQFSATEYISKRRPGAIIGSTLTGGDRSTLTGGDRSTLTGGDRSTLTGGYMSTLTGGDRSTLTGGDRSTLTGGNRSTLILKYYCWKSERYKFSVGYIGEDLRTNQAYRLDPDGKFVEVEL